MVSRSSASPFLKKAFRLGIFNRNYQKVTKRFLSVTSLSMAQQSSDFFGGMATAIGVMATNVGVMATTIGVMATTIGVMATTIGVMATNHGVMATIIAF